jgi:hypothetical protein
MYCTFDMARRAGRPRTRGSVSCRICIRRCECRGGVRIPGVSHHTFDIVYVSVRCRVQAGGDVHTSVGAETGSAGSAMVVRTRPSVATRHRLLSPPPLNKCTVVYMYVRTVIIVYLSAPPLLVRHATYTHRVSHREEDTPYILSAHVTGRGAQ